jgi:hypothetical protein
MSSFRNVKFRNLNSCPFAGVPASLGPELRTVSGAHGRLGEFNRRVTFSIMPRENSASLKAHFVSALAHGVSPGTWARSSGVPSSTAYRWARDPSVRKAVEASRRRTLDLAIGRLTKQSTWAAERISQIAREGKSQAVRLSACRAIKDSAAVARCSELEARLAELESRLSDRARSAESGAEKSA